jgi:hypothetical protein
MRPDLEQERDYLYQISFGVKRTELGRFISRAYRDMNRKLGEKHEKSNLGRRVETS